MNALSEKQFCTFYVDSLFLGVSVQKVQEVIRYQPMTYVPLAPPVIRGLINLRGQIVITIDVRRKLELLDRTDNHPPSNVVIRTEEGVASLLVDEIGDVLQVRDALYERPPETLKGIARELIEGTYKLQGRLLLILNIEKVLDI